jgi:predicted O-linked N-acetylglucosamine transferase (SPINDLY family)
MTLPVSSHSPSRLEAFRRLADEARLRRALAALDSSKDDPAAYIVAARTAKELRRVGEALAILERGINRCPASAELYEYYVERLEKGNRTEQAIATAREAMRLFPEHLIFALRSALALPVFYGTMEELIQYRDRFALGLEQVTTLIPLETTVDRQRALRAVAKNVNTRLVFQGRDDRDLQVRYGRWIHKVMALSFPQWAQPLRMPKIGSDGRIRVGYVSTHMRDPDMMKTFQGWLDAADRSRFSITTYQVGRETKLTDQLPDACDGFRRLSGSLEEIARAIATEDHHVLVYLDLGLKPILTQLAALRLAPIQAAAWDHPVTTGLPTIDYFLTGDLMEPANGQDHYSEQLVRLPGMGLCTPRARFPSLSHTKTRQDFGLDENAVLFLSCQTMIKYLPQQDLLFARIARRVPESQFVFLWSTDLMLADFKRRLGRAFESEGLCRDDYCIILPEQPYIGYRNLLQLADVALDTAGHSGGISTLEAIAASLPVVTLPDVVMRGRQSAAMFTQLGVTDTIARDPEEYVRIAVRLGRDRRWRQGIVERMIHGIPNLFSDPRPVRALEDFYQREVEARLRP